MSLRAAIKSWSSLLAIRVLYHAFERFSRASALIIQRTFASMEDMPHRGQNRTAGQALLAAGKFADGYRLIEQEPGFYRSDEFYKLPKDKRLARGPPVSGKTVLLALEGGFGDERGWGRYAQHLKKAGARVLVGALPGSLGTLRTLLGADEVKRFDLIKPHEYHYYLLGMSAADYFDEVEAFYL